MTATGRGGGRPTWTRSNGLAPDVAAAERTRFQGHPTTKPADTRRRQQSVRDGSGARGAVRFVRANRNGRGVSSHRALISIVVVVVLALAAAGYIMYGRALGLSVPIRDGRTAALTTTR